MDTWKLQDAKARFSEVVDRALHDGPQVVTRHGENTVVIVAYREFIGQSRRKISRIPDVDPARRTRHRAIATPAAAHRALSFCAPPRRRQQG
jgi:prevent-host-death family protein